MRATLQNNIIKWRKRTRYIFDDNYKKLVPASQKAINLFCDQFARNTSEKVLSSSICKLSYLLCFATLSRLFRIPLSVYFLLIDERNYVANSFPQH